VVPQQGLPKASSFFGEGYGTPPGDRVPGACYNGVMSNPNEETSTLTRVPSETEAAIVIAALEDNGIKAESDEYTSGLRAGPWNWVDIMVATSDLERAKEVLAQVQDENDHIDWSQVDVGEKEDE
jgi:hypothetical protein